MKTKCFKTFNIEKEVSGRDVEIQLGKKIVQALKEDGIFLLDLTPGQDEIVQTAFLESRLFFRQPLNEKKKLISETSYSGYIASKEEITAGEPDYVETFTICKDVPESDPRTRILPCHGAVPWPNISYQIAFAAYFDLMKGLGENLLRLIALGLDQNLDALTKYSNDGWNHVRAMRFPTSSSCAPGAKGIGSHTDYGLLVLSAQDVAGLYVRPPLKEKRERNWVKNESAAGAYEQSRNWHKVSETNKLVVFPGDILQLITNDYLLSTPHKVPLNKQERFSIAYFHEPSFDAVVRPFNPESKEELHYGQHFTKMFCRSYPDRITTQRIIEENRLENLDKALAIL